MAWPPTLRFIAIYGLNYLLAPGPQSGRYVIEWLSPQGLEINLMDLYLANHLFNDINNKLPESLKGLTFPNHFNDPINTVPWGDPLETIEFGLRFNQPIDDVCWPSSARSITFGKNINQPVDRSQWACLLHLHRLSFGDDFNQPIQAVDWGPRTSAIFLLETR